MEIGPYLRRCREDAKLKMAAVTSALSLKRQTVYLWESSRSRIDAQDIRKLLTFYGCRPEQITYALAIRSGDRDAVEPTEDDTATEFEGTPAGSL